jgi:hypothetical protein
MTTSAEKNALIETIKFTPQTYTIEVSGYGGEIVIGKISEEAYNYWTEKNEEDDGHTLYDYENDRNNELEVPAEFRIFEPGEWYECDNFAHASGAELTASCSIRVYDENNTEVWNSLMSTSALQVAGVQYEEYGDAYVSELPEGTCIFVAQATEKGTLFGGNLYLSAPFDPKSLTITFEEVDGWMLLAGIQYLYNDIENDNYSTTGKCLKFTLIRVG